ncbi:RNA/RNP complex-1-interacting phosphatase isoform X2 [Larimichthys crocea]|uniref:RNA/RNP complex-1-interacting phosphatase isoform X2 n=1 Tax=Larimichthys crocea TaxID=215358 RepID=UPI000F5DF9B2|nr:RNA/RNP complex-1-interacting phosphatase isoform X2 [Larimichthys crocea]
MTHDKKKKKKKRKRSGVPDRWLDYRPVGQRITGTRFIAFKVPLKPSLNCRVPESDSFSLWDLLDHLKNQNQELGLIIDLTFTTRYYSLADVPQSCSYIKILTEGRQVPSDGAILSFKRVVRRFLRENRDNDKLIGVHCTHGLNRTGYLVCRYLVDVDGLDAAAALELFNTCRGHRIERQNYLNDLQGGAKRSNASIDELEEEAATGQCAERPLQGAAATRLTEQRPLQGAAATRLIEQRPLQGDPAGDGPPRNRRRRKPRHQRQAAQKTCDGPGSPQSRLPPAPPTCDLTGSTRTPQTNHKDSK